MAEKKTTTTSKAGGFSAEERAAMKARAQELKAEAKASKDRAAGEQAVLAAIDAMNDQDRAIAKRLHEIVTTTAPHLWPKTWYGFPAYAKDGKVVVFYKSAEKFNSRYATLGFEEAAALDDGEMWPTSYALLEMTPAAEKKITALVKKAAR
jgi:uncharacterized protein YdhG (YjbR/CyaY superfamily)